MVLFTVVKNPYYALAEIRATRADFSMEKGNLERALHQVDGAIDLAPDVGRYYVQRSKILDQARSLNTSRGGRLLLAQEAYSANQKAVAANPFDVYSRLHLAESAFTEARLGQIGKGREALEEYGRLTFMLPRYWLPHFLLGRAYSEMGQPELAIKDYDEAIRLNAPGLVYLHKGMAYAALGQYQRAIEGYDEAIGHNPNLSSAYNQRGVAFYELGQPRKAIAEYGKAIGLNASLDPAYNNRGAAYHDLGQLDRAIEDFDRSLRLNPQFAEAYANRAVVLTLLNRDEEARLDFDRAVALGFDATTLEKALRPSHQPSQSGAAGGDDADSVRR